MRINREKYIRCDEFALVRKNRKKYIRCDELALVRKNREKYIHLESKKRFMSQLLFAIRSSSTFENENFCSWASISESSEWMMLWESDASWTLDIFESSQVLCLITFSIINDNSMFVHLLLSKLFFSSLLIDSHFSSSLLTFFWWWSFLQMFWWAFAFDVSW